MGVYGLVRKSVDLVGSQGSGFMGSGSGLCISGFGIQISGFGFRDWDEGLWLRVQG